MKLAASLFAVAALSLAGCIDDVATGGGHQEGIRPAKPSIDDLDGNSPRHPAVFEGMSGEIVGSPPLVDVNDLRGKVNGIALPPEPARDVCETCEVTAILLPEERGIDEVRVVSDGGVELCRIYLVDDEVIVDECGRF